MILKPSPKIQVSEESDVSELSSLVKTPSSNTGLKCQHSGLTVRIDFLQLVVNLPTVEDFTDLLSLIAPFFDDEFVVSLDVPSVHGKRYAHTARSVRGMLAAFNPPDSDFNLPADCWLSIPGSVLGAVSTQDIYQLSDILVSLDCKVTRFDVALDDYEKSIDEKQVMEACEAGNFAGFRDYDPRFPGRRGLIPGALGWCIYFGSPQSDKRLRFYNKWVESKNQIDAYRWEVQFRGDRANAAFQGFCTSDCDPMFLSSLVTGAVSFVDRNSADRLSRQKLLPWWEEFLDKVGGAIKISLPSPKPSLERSEGWIDRQVVTTLAVFRDIFGPYLNDKIDSWIEKGRLRYSSRHEALIRTAKREWLYTSCEGVTSYGEVVDIASPDPVPLPPSPTPPLPPDQLEIFDPMT